MKHWRVALVSRSFDNLNILDNCWDMNQVGSLQKASNHSVVYWLSAEYKLKPVTWFKRLFSIYHCNFLEDCFFLFVTQHLMKNFSLIFKHNDKINPAHLSLFSGAKHKYLQKNIIMVLHSHIKGTSRPDKLSSTAARRWSPRKN